MYMPITMAKIKNTDNTKCYQGCGTTGIPYIAGERQNGTATLQNNFVVSYRDT